MRAGEHRDGIDADQHGVDDARLWHEAVFGHPALACNQHGRRAVRNLRGGARGMNAPWYNRLQPRECLEARLAQALVPGHVRGLSFYGHYLLTEAALGPCRHRTLL